MSPAAFLIHQVRGLFALNQEGDHAPDEGTASTARRIWRPRGRWLTGSAGASNNSGSGSSRIRPTKSTTISPEPLRRDPDERQEVRHHRPGPERRGPRDQASPAGDRRADRSDGGPDEGGLVDMRAVDILVGLHHYAV